MPLVALIVIFSAGAGISLGYAVGYAIGVSEKGSKKTSYVRKGYKVTVPANYWENKWK